MIELKAKGLQTEQAKENRNYNSLNTNKKTVHALFPKIKLIVGSLL